MKLSQLLGIAGTTILVGCASGGAQINSRTFQTDSEPIKRVLIYFNAKSQHFTGTLYTTFIGATQRRLESCGVAVTVLEFDSLDLDMRAKFAKTIDQANPDVVITFIRNGGNLVTGSGGVSGNLYFDAEASDKKKTKTLWKARVDYRTLTSNLFADDKQSGERFAAQFVSRIAADHLVAGCPADVATPKT
jgi:hypothetical protein